MDANYRALEALKRCSSPARSCIFGSSLPGGGVSGSGLNGQKGRKVVCAGSVAAGSGQG